MKSINTNFKKAVRKWFTVNKASVHDVLLFGSAMKGAVEPNDIDIMLIFNSVVDKKIERSLRKSLEKIETNVSIVSKTVQSAMDPSFSGREAQLFEAYSLITDELVSTRYGYVSYGMFIYDTKPLSNSKKTKFYYAFNGRRSNEGICKRLGLVKISDNVVLVPLDKIKPATDFFELWGIETSYIPTMIPSRLAKEHILKKK